MSKNHNSLLRFLPRTGFVVLVAVLMLSAVVVPMVSASDPLEGLAEKLKDKTPEEQIVLLNGMVEEGTDDAQLHFFLGNAYFALSKYDEAIAEFEIAVKLKEDYSKAWVNMGIVQDTKHNRRAARDAYNRAIELNPEDVLAYCHLGFSFQSAGENEKAMEYYQKALSIDPNSAQAHYNLGLAFAEARIFNEALVEWNKVIELDPDGQLGKIAAENVELIKTYMELGG
jgi:tetratricopeptide (TPR) repeat protein